MTQDIFFRPQPNWVGDVIPWTDQEVISLYYLFDRRTEPKPGMPWHLATTTDLVHYEDRGLALPSGGPEAADFNCYTGSVVKDENGVFHLFYTANNPARLGPDGRSLQLVAHATSTDAKTWTKHPEDTFGAPDGYDPADWRDPFVYKVDGDDHWTLVLAARYAYGADRRRGVVARLTSSDLRHWEIAEPLWDPHRFVTQECPEVFHIGDWWYLVYSEFTDRFVTRYRMSRDFLGPWTAPERDSLDGRGFYAAKSVDWRGRRLFFGWIAGREGQTDDGSWLWAGTMASLEAVQREDGSLAFKIPDEVLDAFGQERSALRSATRVEARTGYGAEVIKPTLPDECLVSADLDWDQGTREVSLLLRTDCDGENGYVLRLEPFAARVVLDRWPRREPGPEQWHQAGDVPHFIELERPADLNGCTAHIDVLMRGELLQICVNKEVCLSTSVYDHATGGVGLAVLDGAVTCSSLTVSTRV